MLYVLIVLSSCNKLKSDVKDLTELHEVKMAARKRVREWAANEDREAGLDGDIHTSKRQTLLCEGQSPIPTRRPTSFSTPSMSKPSGIPNHRPVSSVRPFYKKAESASVNDLSYLGANDDDDNDEGKAVSPYFQTQATSSRLQAVLGSHRGTPKLKPFKPPVKTPASVPFKPPSSKKPMASTPLRQISNEEEAEEEIAKVALIRSRLKVNWSAFG